MEKRDLVCILKDRGGCCVENRSLGQEQEREDGVEFISCDNSKGDRRGGLDGGGREVNYKNHHIDRMYYVVSKETRCCMEADVGKMGK